MSKVNSRSRANGVKKKKKHKRAKKHQAQGSISRTALRCLGVAVCLVLLCSCLSFDIGDWPSGFEYPNNNPTANWCGSIGAFLAYYFMYYFGPGLFVLLIAVAVAMGHGDDGFLFGDEVTNREVAVIGDGAMTGGLASETLRGEDLWLTKARSSESIWARPTASWR